jgi:hypothetical protein
MSVTACVAVGTDGKVLSTSNGTSWGSESSGTTSSLLGISCAGSQFCVAVGLAGVVLARNAGVWHASPSGVTANLASVSCPDVRVCYAVGDAGTILVTRNGAVTWVRKSSGTTAPLAAVDCPTTNVCLAGGAAGTVRFTPDGSNWIALPSLNPNVILAVQYLSTGQVWLAGGGGMILANSHPLDVCAGASVGAAPASPQLPGQTVAFTAASTGCTVPRYEFWLQYPNGTWVMKRGFSTSAAWNWNTAGYPFGNYTLHVWVNQTGAPTVTWEALAEVKYTLKALPPCNTASLSPPAPSQPAG